MIIILLYFIIKIYIYISYIYIYYRDFKNNKIIDEEYDEKLKKLNEKMKNRSNTTTTITKIKTTTKTTIKTTTTTTDTTKKVEPTVPKGRCGVKYGNAKCPSGECCSKHGWCGKSSDHCGSGCQSEFGKCNSNSTSEQKKGRCGVKYGNAKCPSGECCSKHGWCGKSSDHCGSGCQSEFGKCN